MLEVEQIDRSIDPDANACGRARGNVDRAAGRPPVGGSPRGVIGLSCQGSPPNGQRPRTLTLTTFE